MAGVIPFIVFRCERIDRYRYWFQRCAAKPFRFSINNGRANVPSISLNRHAEKYIEALSKRGIARTLKRSPMVMIIIKFDLYWTMQINVAIFVADNIIISIFDLRPNNSTERTNFDQYWIWDCQTEYLWILWSTRN